MIWKKVVSVISHILVWLFLLISLNVQAENVSMEFKRVNLIDALNIIAKLLKLNIIISPSIRGAATLQLNDAQPEQAFDLLLNSNGLAKWQMGNVWFIAPQEELIKHKQNELRWQEILNDSSPLTSYFREIKFAKANDIARMLHDEQATLISKKGFLRVDARTNTIYIHDTIEHIKRIKRIIARIDIPVKQILIKTRLVSIDNDFERELGIQFSMDEQPETTDSLKLKTNHLFSLMTTKLANDTLLDVKLSALEKAGHAEIISSPSLFTANQLQASIEAGEEVPYQEMSDKGVTAVTFKKAVLGLKVTPQVLPGNKVLLQLQINQDRPNNRLVLGMPMISTRQIITSVLVKNGQTLVLGGIYEMSQEKGQQQIPFISRLPLIGLLFKQETVKKMKRQLLIFVTPKIVE